MNIDTLNAHCGARLVRSPCLAQGRLKHPSGTLLLCDDATGIGLSRGETRVASRCEEAGGRRAAGNVPPRPPRPILGILSRVGLVAGRPRLRSVPALCDDERLSSPPKHHLST